MKEINELYNLVLKRAEFYGIKLNWKLKERILTNFESSVDNILETTEWSFNDKISLEDFNNILDGFEEFFETLEQNIKE